MKQKDLDIKSELERTIDSMYAKYVPSNVREFIDMICKLYGDSYDDREEDSAPGGLDWIPGQKAQHKSLHAFRKELAEVHDIES